MKQKGGQIQTTTYMVYMYFILSSPMWFERVQIPAGSDICHRGCASTCTVLQTAQYLECAVLSMGLCTIKEIQ